MTKIDLDRGVITRITHAGQVSMYVDAPGRFFGAQGEPVSDEEAQRAGFDVEREKLEMRKQARLAKARAEIDAIWESELEAMETAEPLELPTAPLQQTTTPPNPDEGWKALAELPLK